MENNIQQWLESARKSGQTKEQITEQLKSRGYSNEIIIDLLNRDNQEIIPGSEVTGKYYIIPSWSKPSKKIGKISRGALVAVFSRKSSLYYIWLAVLALVLAAIIKNIVSLFQIGLPTEDYIIGIIAILLQGAVFYLLYHIHYIGDRLLVIMTGLSLLSIGSAGYFNFLIMLTLFMLYRYVILGVEKLSTTQNTQGSRTPYANREPKWSHLKMLLIIVVLIIGVAIFAFLMYDFISCGWKDFC